MFMLAKPVANTSGTKPCMFCNSRGAIGVWATTCPVCRGKRAITAGPYAKPCPNCRNTGKAGTLDYDPKKGFERCHWCNGTGWKIV